VIFLLILAMLAGITSLADGIAGILALTAATTATYALAAATRMRDHRHPTGCRVAHPWWEDPAPSTSGAAAALLVEAGLAVRRAVAR
jgi:hypothetical protein